MNISDILSEDMILTDVNAESKRHLLENISEFVAQKSGLDKNDVCDSILERENLGSTGYGKGIALPHARINGLEKVVCAFVRLSKGIDYESLDGQPVDLLAFLVTPEKSGENHLQALAAFSLALKDENVCRRIREARSAHEIYVALQK